MERSRRKKHLVDKKLQYRLLAFNGLYFLILVAAMAIALFAPLIGELSGPDLSAIQKGEAAAKVLYIHATFWPAVIFVLLILGAHSVLVSNKIAGPLHRFQRMFEKIRNGDLSDMMTIRKGDYLMSEQTKIAGMMDALREKIERIRCEEGAMEQALKDFRRLWGDTMNAEARASLASLEEHHRRLKEEIAFFKTSPGPGSHE
jgi:methyl-accepting chemotaxis protein